MQLCVKVGCGGGSNILMPSSRTSFVWVKVRLGPAVYPLQLLVHYQLLSYLVHSSPVSLARAMLPAAYLGMRWHRVNFGT
jgi:hypothetical protein